ncbi:hypothetical protein Nepgr_023158 [Nepenthes gracilis]|uniref:Uncharacterized protein n=1 Tax=Nepenthes gracilis TaxID=150966 RepID=A0AAD3XZ42_NEPGR|nr:hypothetical protein Nepgr_023158 [Nepenthes gracilis]
MDRLRFARICVQISASYPLPEQIRVNTGSNPGVSEGVDVIVDYPWKPGQCKTGKASGSSKIHKKAPPKSKPVGHKFPAARELEPKVSKGRPGSPVASVKPANLVFASNSFAGPQNPEEPSLPKCFEGGDVIDAQGRAEPISVFSMDVVETEPVSLDPSERGEDPCIESAQAFGRPVPEGHCSDQLVTFAAPLLLDDDLLKVNPLRQALSGASSSRLLTVVGATHGPTSMLHGDPPSAPVNKTGESFLPKSILKKTKEPKKKNSPSSKAHV